ncbi:MAG: antitoxin VbhA family protein [Endomicrobium sp.]|jgi:putative transcriptional regulator|nr:antitoxin VbhA family protein [Endomicrobium sp.]
MPYKTISIDEKRLTIMGVVFPDIKALRSAADAIGSNMFEGFEPTAKSVVFIRDYILGKISLQHLIKIAKDKSYE